MVELALPLVMLNSMALIMCLCALFTAGSEAKDAVKVYLIESYVSLTAFSLILLVAERIVFAIIAHFHQLSILSAKMREMLHNLVTKVLDDGVCVKYGNNVLMTSNMLQHQAKDSAVAANNTNTQLHNLSPESNTSSGSGTPAFTQTEKETLMANDDACSAATTM
jgi:hypothetical protein